MTKKILFTFLALFFASTFSFSQTADDCVTKFIEALGGKEKLAGLQTLKSKASVEVAPNMKAPITAYYVNNKSVRTEVELQGMKMIQVIDGDSGWYVQPFGGKKDPERMDAEMVREGKDEVDILGPLYNYKEKGSTVELIGKEDMEGTETFKLKVTKKNADVEYIYLDATSYLQLKQTSKHKFKDKEVESETLFSNYKKVDGIMFAFTAESRQVGEAKGQEIIFDSIEVNPKIDNSIFRMPPPGPAPATPEKDKK